MHVVCAIGTAWAPCAGLGLVVSPASSAKLREAWAQAERVEASAACARGWLTCAREAVLGPGRVHLVHFEALAPDPARTRRGMLRFPALRSWSPAARGLVGPRLAATRCRQLQWRRRLPECRRGRWGGRQAGEAARAAVDAGPWRRSRSSRIR